MTSEISFLNLPYFFRQRFIHLLPSEQRTKFIQTSSSTLKESINVLPISEELYQTKSTRVFLSNTQSTNFEIRDHLITLYCGYDNFNTFKFYSTNELVLKLDASVMNDAIDAYRKFNFNKLTMVMMKEFNIRLIFDNIFLNRKCDHLKFYGYIPAEYLCEMSDELCKFKSVMIKNLNPSFPILDLKELQKFYTSFLQRSKVIPSKFEIVQIVPSENLINVLALENEIFILHSYFQPKSDIPFLFYE